MHTETTLSLMSAIPPFICLDSFAPPALPYSMVPAPRAEIIAA